MALSDVPEGQASLPAECESAKELEDEPALAAEAAEVTAWVDTPAAAQPGMWQRVLRMAGLGRPTGTELEMRLADLNRAIAEHPDAAMNYVLRGELYLEVRDDQLARADFEQALALAAQEVETADWGIIAQVAQDRAAQGLRLLGTPTGL